MSKPWLIYEITQRCNNHCRYCYNVWKTNGDYPAGELDFARVRELFDKLLSEISPAGITLAGGEPLLRSDLREVVSLFSKKNILTGIASNGVLLDKDTTAQLIEEGVRYFEISLPAVKSETYKKLCGADNLAQVRKSIANVKKHRIKLTVSFVATRQNINQLNDCIEVAYALGADGFAVNRFVPGGEGLKYLDELAPGIEQLREVLDIANTKAYQLNFPVNITIPVENCLIDHQDYPKLNFAGCVCGRDKWVIDSCGNLRTCEQNPQIIGSLFEEGFDELAQSENAVAFRNDYLNENCRSCDSFGECFGGCRYVRSASQAL